jgi:hypothetical protein
MIDYLRLKSPWSQFGVFLGLLGSAFILTMLVSTAVLLASGMPAPNAGNWEVPGFVKIMKVLQALSSVLLFFIPAVLFGLVVFNYKPFYFLGFRPPVSPNMYVLAAVCMLTTFPIVSSLGDLNHAIPLPEWMVTLEKDTSKQMTAFLKADSVFDIIINVIIMALLPAICEEILFRGALQRIMIHITKNPWQGIIITAILFSALHFQFLGFLPRLFLGIVLGAIYWYSGSLWASILGHFIYNGVQVVAVAFAPQYIDKNPEVPMFYSFISVVAVIAIIWAMRKQSTITYAKVYEPNALNDSNQFIA